MRSVSDCMPRFPVSILLSCWAMRCLDACSASWPALSFSHICRCVHALRVQPSMPDVIFNLACHSNYLIIWKRPVGCQRDMSVNDFRILVRVRRSEPSRARDPAALSTVTDACARARPHPFAHPQAPQGLGQSCLLPPKPSGAFKRHPTRGVLVGYVFPRITLTVVTEWCNYQKC